jgi:outer membrane protein assembly factor BamB
VRLLLLGQGAVLALDAATGERRWATPIDAGGPPIFERLWLDGDTLVLPTAAGPVLGLDAGSGAERWRYDPPAPRQGGSAVDRGLVWMVLRNSHVVALDAASGQVVGRLASLDLDLSGQGFTQRPAIVGERVVVPLGRWLLGLSIPARPGRSG